MPRNSSPRRRPRLFFGRGNAKIGRDVFTFSLPSGHSCRYAKACRSSADRETGRVTDGPHAAFRCFSASTEALHPSVRRSRWRNLDLLKACRSLEAMSNLMWDSLPADAPACRIHVAGDFFSRLYFEAWLNVAEARPQTRFYFYTKALPLWTDQLDRIGDGHSPGRLVNVVPTASYGGTHDELIGERGLRCARVVYSAAEAAALGLEVDRDDSHAQRHGEDFALLLHGAQPAGSAAAKAVAALRAADEFGHGEKADRRRELRVVRLYD